MANELSTVANFRVRQGSDMLGLINAVKESLKKETRAWASTQVGIDSFNRWTKIAEMAGDSVTPLIGLFREMRKYAEGRSAPLTADAIRQSAKWFYENVEGGMPITTPSFAPSGLDVSFDQAVSSATASAKEAKPRRRRRKRSGIFDLKTGLIVGVPVALGLGLLVYTFATRKRQAT